MFFAKPFRSVSESFFPVSCFFAFFPFEKRVGWGRGEARIQFLADSVLRGARSRLATQL